MISINCPDIHLIMLNLIDNSHLLFGSIDGLIIGKTENLGYMSGLTKDIMIDVIMSSKIIHSLSVIYYVGAGIDGEGCKVALN